jgi:hypothetical protein
MITNIRKKVRTTSHRNACPSEPERLPVGARGQGGADVGDIAERGAQDQRRGQRSRELRAPVAEDARPGEVAGEREGEADGRVEVRAGDVPDRVDHGHDYQAEGEGDPDVSERLGLGVDHDRPGAGEDEGEGPYRFGPERAGQRRRLQRC